MTAHIPNPSGVSAGQLFRILTAEQRRIIVQAFVQASEVVINLNQGQLPEGYLETAQEIRRNWNGK